MSQRLGSKGPVERSGKKNMDPIKVDPALTQAYLGHEKETREHIRIHNEFAKRQKLSGMDLK